MSAIQTLNLEAPAPVVPSLQDQKTCHCCGAVIGIGNAHVVVFGWKYLPGHASPDLIRQAKEADQRNSDARQTQHYVDQQARAEKKAEQAASLRSPDVQRELLQRFGLPGYVLEKLAIWLEHGGRIEHTGGTFTSQPPARTVVGPGSFEMKQ